MIHSDKFTLGASLFGTWQLRCDICTDRVQGLISEWHPLTQRNLASLISLGEAHWNQIHLSQVDAAQHPEGEDHSQHARFIPKGRP